MRDFEELRQIPFPRICAVDIGINGGICYNSTIHKNVLIEDMPPDLRGLHDILATANPDKIIAENVHTWKGQGIKSSGTLMQSKGRLEGIAVSLGCNIEWIEPKAWIECFTMKSIKNFDSKTLWKKHLLKIAQEITMRGELSLKTADAVLMWIYAAHMENGFELTKVGKNLW